MRREREREKEENQSVKTIATWLHGKHSIFTSFHGAFNTEQTPEHVDLHQQLFPEQHMFLKFHQNLTKEKT